MSGSTDCENCMNYIYDEEYDCYECHAYFDEDELVKLYGSTTYQCPYYQYNDEYKIVRKQI
ncbi:DUF6472 family protein [Anaerobium acetethylicum]|uniref:DUF6472 domain-containing protein n=1 Tax=Anaerobium acetethylicum TaxID=1619234 RepID=A0A1D3TN77_9FIRM|nr:DUF6472 family protein [Anaerobium acetethylicum]SCP94752.1 hypothetical protein SAMN05421730_100124 [Anaerobium acetethylicum]